MGYRNYAPSTSMLLPTATVFGPDRTPLRYAGELVESAILSARSENTVRSYRTQWPMWSEWATRSGVSALPANPRDIVRYLALRADRGLAITSIGSAAAAIAAVHVDVNLESPCEHPGVRRTIKGLTKQLARPQAQATVLLSDDLEAIRATASLRRRGRVGRMESSQTAMRRGRVDIALGMVMRDAGLRRSEAAELLWGDVEWSLDGSGRITVCRLKTDGAAEGATVAATRSTMRALDQIRPPADDWDPGARVFGLGSAQISRRIAAAAKAAGLGGEFSGHSPRVGLARSMASKGAPTSEVMKQGRWPRTEMVVRYTRAEAAGHALRWLE